MHIHVAMILTVLHTSLLLVCSLVFQVLKDEIVQICMHTIHGCSNEMKSSTLFFTRTVVQGCMLYLVLLYVYLIDRIALELFFSVFATVTCHMPL